MSTAADRRNVFGTVPFMRLLGVQREFSEGGRARLVMEERADTGNHLGTAHGGVVAALLDVVMASAAISQLDFTRTAVTLTLGTTFLGPGRGRLTADGEVVSHDDEIAWCKATVTDSQDRPVAQAQGSFRYVPFP